MIGIRLTFNEDGPRFDFSSSVRKFDSTVQNAMVHVGTDLGSDPIYTTRGTDLKRDGAHGRMSTNVWANHASNFAALRTLAFVQQTDMETNPFKLQEFNLRCREVFLTIAVLEVQAISTLGQVVGGFANI